MRHVYPPVGAGFDRLQEPVSWAVTMAHGIALGLDQGTETHGQPLRERRQLATGEKARNGAGRQRPGVWAPSCQTHHRRGTAGWEAPEV